MEFNLEEAQNFVNWLSTKMYLNSIADSSASHFVKKGEVYWCNFGYNIGAEMRKTSPRPCVIVQGNFINKHSQNVIVCPITHTRRDLPCLISIGIYKDENGKTLLDGKVNVANVVCVSKARLENKVIPDKLNGMVMRKIDNAIIAQLALGYIVKEVTSKLKEQLRSNKKLLKENIQLRNQIKIVCDYFGVDSFKKLQEKFDIWLENNIGELSKTTPLNPTLSKDDEWRNPEYDVYDKIVSHRRTLAEISQSVQEKRKENSNDSVICNANDENEFYSYIENDVYEAILNSYSDDDTEIIINNVVFYVDKSLKITDELKQELYEYTLDSDEEAYSVYFDESAGLVVF